MAGRKLTAGEKRVARQRGWARKATALETMVLERLRTVPVAVVALKTGREKLCLGERIPKALTAARSSTDALSGEALQAVIEARGAWMEADALRWKMVESVRSFIVQQARKYLTLSLMDEDDLLQEGRLGAYRAALRYDPDQQAFTTYSRWWIRASITRAIDQTGKLVRMPSGAQEQLRNLRNLEKERFKNRQPITDEALAETSGIDLKRVRLLRSQRIPMSLDGPVPGLSAGGTTLQPSMLTFGALLEDELAIPPDEAAERSQLVGRLQPLLAGFDERTLLILTRYYGLDGRKAQTLASIGQDIGLSRERVRQIERSALKELANRPELHDVLPEPALPARPQVQTWTPEHPYRHGYRGQLVRCSVVRVCDGWVWQVRTRSRIRTRGTATSWSAAVKTAQFRVTGKCEIPEELQQRRAA